MDFRQTNLNKYGIREWSWNFRVSWLMAREDLKSFTSTTWKGELEKYLIIIQFLLNIVTTCTTISYMLCYMIFYRSLDHDELYRGENEAALHNPTGDKLGST